MFGSASFSWLDKNWFLFIELSPNWLLQAFQQQKYNASVICITGEEWDWKLLANIDTFFFYLIKTSNNSLIKISQYRLLFILVIEPLFGDSKVQFHQTWWAEIVYLLHLKQTVNAPHVRRPPECKRLNLRPFIHNFHCKENKLIIPYRVLYIKPVLYHSCLLPTLTGHSISRTLLLVCWTSFCLQTCLN